MSTYCTRIYVKVDAKELMEKLCTMDVSDLGKGYYKAGDIFKAGSVESNFYDGESGINECDLQTLVGRAVEIIKGHGTILADTFSYDYDPFPQVCYYTGNEIVSKLLDVDGGEFSNTVDISKTSKWIKFVENADAFDEDCENEDLRTELINTECNFNVGDVISFGSYEQDNNRENGPEAIEWQIIDKQDNKVLLISKYVIDTRKYTANATGATWETSDLRQWLNGEFFNAAFSEGEKATIQSTLIKDKATKRVPNPGNPTEDKVFALSEKELEKYFKNRKQRICKATPYTIAQLMNLYNYCAEDVEEPWWYLRCVCSNTGDTTGVGYDGDVYYTEAEKFCIRPVLWLALPC